MGVPHDRGGPSDVLRWGRETCRGRDEVRSVVQEQDGMRLSHRGGDGGVGNIKQALLSHPGLVTISGNAESGFPLESLSRARETTTTDLVSNPKF
jgi:hypothetical protein